MGGGLESRCVGRLYGAGGAVAPDTCRAKNTSIKLPSSIKLVFHFISCGRCTVKQLSTEKKIEKLILKNMGTNCTQFRKSRKIFGQ